MNFSFYLLFAVNHIFVLSLAPPHFLLQLMDLVLLSPQCNLDLLVVNPVDVYCLFVVFLQLEDLLLRMLDFRIKTALSVQLFDLGINLLLLLLHNFLDEELPVAHLADVSLDGVYGCFGEFALLKPALIAVSKRTELAVPGIFVGLIMVFAAIAEVILQRAHIAVRLGELVNRIVGAVLESVLFQVLAVISHFWNVDYKVLWLIQLRLEGVQSRILGQFES